MAPIRGAINIAEKGPIARKKPTTSSGNSKKINFYQCLLEKKEVPKLSKFGTINVIAAPETISRPNAYELILRSSHRELSSIELNSLFQTLLPRFYNHSTRHH